MCSLAGRCETMGDCVPLCGAPSGSHSAALHTIVTLSEDFPTPQEALDAGPIDEPLHTGLIRSSPHELQPHFVAA